jgi:hypothetical protein
MTKHLQRHLRSLRVLGASMALAGASCEEEADDVALILECFQHTDEDDDPCPRGCAQVPGSQFRVVWLASDVCEIALDMDGDLATPKFCAPGDAMDYQNGTGWEGVFRRLDLESPSRAEPLLPEDVRVMSPGVLGRVPGWEFCYQEDSALCGCASKFTEE